MPRPGIATPDSYASTTAWTRSRSPSFISMRATWVLTVVSLTISSAAISALESPRATHLNTSSSRAVSSSRPGGGAGGVGDAVFAQLTRVEADELDLSVGDIVWLRPPVGGLADAEEAVPEAA